MKIKKWKHEWYLYSAASIVASLSFISINVANGRAQVMGLAFSTIVGLFLFASKNWKESSIEVHKFSIMLSIIVVLIVSGIKLLNKKEHYED